MTDASGSVESSSRRQTVRVLADPTDQTRDDAIKPLGRRARKAMAVRQSLFAAGLAAFERQPIGLVSVLDITEAADVAKGVFYLHFRSKDDYLLALWENVQHSFRDTVRAAMLGRRSQRSRIEAAVRQFAALPTDQPAAARFWIRMSSYFPDEVGEPGHLTRIHQDHAQELAATLAARPPEQITPGDLRVALLVDSICWAVIRSSLATAEPLGDAEMLVRIVAAAVRTAGSTDPSS